MGKSVRRNTDDYSGIDIAAETEFTDCLEKITNKNNEYENKKEAVNYFDFVLHPKSWTQDWRCSFYEQIKKRR